MHIQTVSSNNTIQHSNNHYFNFDLNVQLNNFQVSFQHTTTKWRRTFLNFFHNLCQKCSTQQHFIGDRLKYESTFAHPICTSTSFLKPLTDYEVTYQIFACRQTSNSLVTKFHETLQLMRKVGTRFTLDALKQLIFGKFFKLLCDENASSVQGFFPRHKNEKTCLLN